MGRRAPALGRKVKPGPITHYRPSAWREFADRVIYGTPIMEHKMIELYPEDSSAELAVRHPGLARRQ